MGISEGEVSLVTGGASGIGKALVEMLASQGGRVIVADLNLEGSSALAESLNKKHGKGEKVMVAVHMDVTKWESQVAAFETGKQAFGRIDYVVANAGIAEKPWLPSLPQSSSSSSSKSYVRPDYTTLSINLSGTLDTASLALQTFASQPVGANGFRGKLLFTASVYGLYAQVCSNCPMYAVAKSGVVAFVRSASGYWKDQGVTINAVCPNLTHTNIISPEAMQLFAGNLIPPVKIAEQFVALMGKNPATGQAVGVNVNGSWEHPVSDYKWDENVEVMSKLNNLRPLPSGLEKEANGLDDE